MPEITNKLIAQKYTDAVLKSRREFLRFNKTQSRRLHGIMKSLHNKLTLELAAIGDNPMREAHLAALRRNLGRYVSEFERDYSHFLHDSVLGSAKNVANREDQIASLYTIGVDKSKMNLNLAFTNIAALPAESLYGIYLKDAKKLCDRIWALTEYTNRQIENTVVQAVYRGQSAVKLSKELEQFLLPGKWGPAWTTRITPAKIYDLAGIEFTKGTISYNALRLARTAINHAHREAHISRLRFYKEAGLPIGQGVKWNLSKSHFQRTPKGDICDQEWAVGGPKGDGVYPLDDPAWPIPIDHPNGLCNTTTALVPVDEFRKWVDSQKVGEYAAGKMPIVKKPITANVPKPKKRKGEI